MKAVILTRVSTKMQEERLSLRAQSKRLEEYAERRELDVIKRFEIIESSTRGERKRFMEMINFCKKQKETIAIVADTVDRVQRSFKESVLLDELMRQDKIELHFYREGMILNSKSTSADIMRWDFSVMGAKAYVLQLSENVRRSTELKTKNGERCGVAPLGYENYVDERGKHNIRLKEPEAGIIKQIFELYALGKMSILEAVHFADLMGLKTRAGKKLVNSSIYYILDNPFYYGEMKTKRGIIKHVYPPLISQELWEQCQKQKALNNHNGAGLKYSQKPFVLRGLITCGRTGRVCPCEDQLRRKYYSWVVCYTKTGQRRYIPEQDVLSAIETILNRIKVPDSLINPLYEEIKNAEISEKQYCQQEIGKLRQEQEKLKAKLDIFPSIQRGKRLIKDNQISGNVPYVSSTAMNNGIDNFIQYDSKKMRKFKNCLSVANSGSVGSSFYEPFEYIASDHITHLKNDKFNQYIYFFIATMTNRWSQKYNFNREINDPRISREKILLPVNSNDEPDYIYMEKYIKNIFYKKYSDYLKYVKKAV